MRRFDREHRGRAWLAWHTAICYRAKEMPRLDALTGTATSKTVRQPRRQSLDEMRQNAMLFTQLLGGIVRRREPSDA